MGLINQDIKNLVSGISQQPPILRHPEQLQEQLNGFSTEAGGLQKRPPTLFVNALQTYTKEKKPNIHFINRDSTEQYCLIFDGDTINVYDLQGNKKSVVFDEDQDYIMVDNPRSMLKMITIADYTFIVNTNKVVEMDEALSTDYWSNQGLLVNIKSGQYGRTYKVEINGAEVASYTTPDGSQSAHTKQIATDYIAKQLADKIATTTQQRVVKELETRFDDDGNAYQVEVEKTITVDIATGLTAVTGASWLCITGEDINTFNVYDGYNNQAAFGFHKTTQKFSNLPSTAPDGFTVLVKGEQGSETDDYYIRYDAHDQVWKETLKPSIPYKYKLETMPHVLVRDEYGVFHFKRAEWSEREIGDDKSNPLPSFIDFNINDIFYHRNRLGFLAGENVILTRSADFFNFWMQSATKVQDTDPIDLAASANNICTLYNAVPYDGDLIIFSREAQFCLSADGILSPKSANLPPPITNYEASLKAKPVNAGRNIYFPAERALYTTMREFFTAADNTEARDVQDITSHCPNYIPNGVYKIIPSTVENILLSLTEGEEESIYVYKYLFIDGQRVQAAWSKWNFQDKIYGGAFIDDLLYLVISRNGYLCLEKISFTFNTTDYIYEPYRVFLDSKRCYIPPVSTYDSLNDETVINLSTIFGSQYEPSLSYSAVATDGTYITAKDGKLTFLGNYTKDTLTVGINYNFKVVMSTIMVKQTNQDNTKAMTEGRLQLRHMWFNYSDTGYFKVVVATRDKGKYVYEHTSRVLGTKTNILGELPTTTGAFKFPVQSKNENVTISLESDAPLPISLVGAGWAGNYQRRTRLV